MTIQNGIEKAQQQFSQLSKVVADNIVHKYATEELKLTGQGLIDFLFITTDLNVEHGVEEEVSRFYTWFYINYAQPIVQNHTELQIYDLPKLPLTNIVIQAQMEGFTGTERYYSITDENHADRWMLLGITWEEQFVPLLSCTEHLLMLQFRQLLKHLLQQQP